jgi:malate synthase
VLLRNKVAAGLSSDFEAQHMQRCLSMEMQTEPESRHSLLLDAASPARGDTVSRAEFLLRIDSCVRYLAALLAGLEPLPVDRESPPAERGRAQLWHWLHGGKAFLEDGTPIDFAVFDAAIQRVGERLPRRGLPGQENVLQAACLLAELSHARTLADPVLVSALARKP